MKKQETALLQQETIRIYYKKASFKLTLSFMIKVVGEKANRKSLAGNKKDSYGNKDCMKQLLNMEIT